MDMMEKLDVLTNGAKYDAACTSSGVDRNPSGPGIGSSLAMGCCHSFSADGRCISLLKVLMTNVCVYDCAYCVNRRSNDVRRATFTPEELADLTIQFYRRNYIEGLFLSSGVLKNPDYTMERMVRVLDLLRNVHRFHGYLHVKVIPGASRELIYLAGALADRVSVNIEFPSEQSLRLYAPDKTKASILGPMGEIKRMLDESRQLRLESSKSPKLLGSSQQPAQNFALAPLPSQRSDRAPPQVAGGGQATQMIIGASPETDFKILRLAEGLYHKYSLKRVFYSAYIPMVEHSLLPAPDTKPPLLREHRLYQADFLLRQYHFTSGEILDDNEPNFNPYLDPKCNWALHHPQFFPVDVQRASQNDLLRVPGIGPRSAKRIVAERLHGKLDFPALKRMGVVLKRAQFFILAADHPRGLRLPGETVARALIDPKIFSFGMEQLSLFTPEGLPAAADVKSIGQGVEEAVQAMKGLVRAA